MPMREVTFKSVYCKFLQKIDIYMQHRNDNLHDNITFSTVQRIYYKHHFK